MVEAAPLLPDVGLASITGKQWQQYGRYGLEQKGSRGDQSSHGSPDSGLAATTTSSGYESGSSADKAAAPTRLALLHHSGAVC